MRLRSFFYQLIYGRDFPPHKRAHDELNKATAEVLKARRNFEQEQSRHNKQMDESMQRLETVADVLSRMVNR